MKKIMFVVMVAAMVLFAVSPLFAQGSKMMFGVKAGLNISNLTGDDVNDTSSRTGLIIGGLMCYNFTEIFALQPELLYTMKGATGKDDEGADLTWSLDYIEIPVLLKVTLPMDGKIKPMLYAGPGFGILVSSKLGDEDVKDQTASTDIGIVAGGGIAYKLNEKNAITLEARYEVGMMSIFKNEDDTGSKPDAKNSVISFLVGYAF